MKISIVTAVYNRVSTVGQAIESVQGQTHPDIEHLIQDGGSKDGTLDVIHRLANGTTCLVSEPDGGIYDAINLGIGRASGDVVGLMHSDDAFAHNDVLTRVAQLFEDPDVDAVYGDLDYVSATDDSRVIRHWKSGPYHRGLLKRGWMPPHPTFYMRRHLFETWGLYDTSFRIAADYDAMLRYLWTGQIRAAYLPEVMVKMRLGGASNGSLKRILRKSREDYRALRNNGVGGMGSLALKNTSKLKQFIMRDSQSK